MLLPSKEKARIKCHVLRDNTDGNPRFIQRELNGVIPIPWRWGRSASRAQNNFSNPSPAAVGRRDRKLTLPCYCPRKKRTEQSVTYYVTLPVGVGASSHVNLTG